MSEHAAVTVGWVVSGDHGSAGKTTVSIGLSRVLRDRGAAVQPFKKGPDFIDPMWLGRASGRAARNLDFSMMGPTGVRERFLRHSAGATVALLEGNKGLFDGVDPSGGDSTAAMAKLLGLPVVLVVDCARMTRGIAPLLRGYSGFEEGLGLAGVVLNNVSGARHEGKLRAAVETYTDVPVLGVVARTAALQIRERHLGLTPDVETEAAEALIGACAAAVSEGTDVDRILAQAARWTSPALALATGQGEGGERVSIAVARDAAFSFYYQESLEALEEAGAELIFFSPLADRLPPCDGVYLGGGFPELYAGRLAANASFLAELREHARSGVVYAECGGLMVLGRSLEVGDVTYPMASVLPLRAEMTDRPVGRGYMRLAPRGGNELWDVPVGGRLWAHEFHHSRVELDDASATGWAYQVERGAGVGGGRDGVLQGGVLASYAHLHPASAPWWARSFVLAARRVRAKRTSHELRLAV